MANETKLKLLLYRYVKSLAVESGVESKIASFTVVHIFTVSFILFNPARHSYLKYIRILSENAKNL